MRKNCYVLLHCFLNVILIILAIYVRLCWYYDLTLSPLFIDTGGRDYWVHGSRLGCETIGLSRSTLQRALLAAILLTSIRGIRELYQT